MQLFRLFGDIFIDDKDARGKIDRIDGKAVALGKQLGKLGDGMIRFGRSMSLYVTAPIIAGFTLATREFALLEGATDKFNVVFGEFADEMHDWVNEFRNNVPLARREIIQHAAAMQDLLVPMGISRELAKDMTQEWMFLAAALAAFNDVPVDQALEAIRSGIAGQSRPLRQFGIDVRETTLDQYALEQGLIKAGEQMTEQIRQQALLGVAYQMSQDAIDGYEDQLGSMLMKQQEVWASVKDLAAEIGEVLAPYVLRLIEYVQRLIDWFRELDTGAKQAGVVIAAIAAAIGPVLIIGGLLVKAIGAIIAVLGAAALPVLAVIAVIAAFAAMLVAAWQHSEEFRERVTEVLGKAWEFIQDIFEQIKDAIARSMGDSEFSFESFMDKVTEVLIQVIDIIEKFIDLATLFWDEYGEDIIALTESAFGAIWRTIESVLTIVSGILDTFIGLITGDWDLFTDGIGQTWAGTVGLILSASEAWAEQMLILVGTLFGDMASAFLSVQGNAWGWGFDLLKAVWDGMKWVYDRLKTWFDENVKPLLNQLNPLARFSPSLVDQVWEGVREIERAYKSLSIPEFMPPQLTLAGTGQVIDQRDFSRVQTFSPTFISPQPMSPAAQRREFEKYNREMGMEAAF